MAPTKQSCRAQGQRDLQPADSRARRMRKIVNIMGLVMDKGCDLCGDYNYKKMKELDGALQLLIAGAQAYEVAQTATEIMFDAGTLFEDLR